MNININFNEKTFEITRNLLYSLEIVSKAFKESMWISDTSSWKRFEYLSFTQGDSGVFGHIMVPYSTDCEFWIENVCLDDVKFLTVLCESSEVCSHNNGFHFRINGYFPYTLRSFITALLENYNTYEEEYPDIFDILDSDDAAETATALDDKVKAAQENYYSVLRKISDADIVERLYSCTTN